MSAEKANPNFDKFDPTLYFEEYYKSTEGEYGEASFSLLASLLKSMGNDFPKVTTVLDIGSGPIVFAPSVMRNLADAFYLSDYGQDNREALRKWIQDEPLTYNFDYITNIMMRAQETADSLEDVYATVRSKIKAVLDLDIFADPMIKSIHWRKEDDLAVPKKFQVVMSHYALTNVCETVEGFNGAVRKASDLIEDNGFLMLSGYLRYPKYSHGDVHYNVLSLTMEQTLHALKASGMATVEGEGFHIISHEFEEADTSKEKGNANVTTEYVLVSRKL